MHCIDNKYKCKHSCKPVNLQYIFFYNNIYIFILSYKLKIYTIMVINYQWWIKINIKQYEPVYKCKKVYNFVTSKYKY